MYRRADKNINKKRMYFKIAVISIFLGMTAVFIISAMFSVIMQFIDFSEKICNILSIFILTSGAFISGRTGAFLCRRNGAFFGILFGLIFGIFAYCLSSVLACRFLYHILSRLLLCIISGLIGGITGVNISLKGMKFSNYRID